MNLIPPELLAQANQAMEDVFDTFSRDSTIRFYQKEKISAITKKDSHMSDFKVDADGFLDATREILYVDFPARVRYLDRQENNLFLKGDDSNIRFGQRLNRLEVQVKPDAFDYLQNTVRWEFEGRKYNIEEEWSKHGILGSWNISMVILKEVK